MSYDMTEHPYDREDREIREAFEAKDKEIARLLAINAEEQETIEELSGLVTRLADALVSAEADFVWYNEGDPLIQEAREAVEG